MRLVGWNAVLFVAGLTLVVLTGEVWLRSTVPFRKIHAPTVFVPDVGVLLRPDSEVRWTNGLDFWTVSRTNSLGFLDREPPSPERAAESCHIAMIGASFVEAREVSIVHKFHVRLEEMAARELPLLNITTSAWSIRDTGQINQIPFYDEYVRRQRPKLVVLVLSFIDYIRNAQWFFFRWIEGENPYPYSYLSAAKDADGAIRLHPPSPNYREYFLPPPESWARKIRARVYRMLWFADWLASKKRLLFPATSTPNWRRVARDRLAGMFAEAESSRDREETLGYTAFALDQFKERTKRDGVSLAILTNYTVERFGGHALHELNAMAEARDIPVINLRNYIIRRGSSIADVHWAHDIHWNSTGHQYAAEVLLEFLKQNQTVCE